MHVYTLVNENIQKKIDIKIHRNNKILLNKLHTELQLYLFKKNIHSCNFKDVKLTQHCILS